MKKDTWLLIKKIASRDYFVFMCIVLILMWVFSLSFFEADAPFRRMNYDSFTQMGHIIAWGGEYNEDLFPGIFTNDLRTQTIPRFLFTLNSLFSLSPETLLFLFGVFNIGLISYALYRLAEELSLNKKETIMFLLLYFFSLGFGWETNTTGFTILGFADNVINAFYPQVFATSLLIFIILELYVYRRNQKIKRAALTIGPLLIALIIFHLFTAGLAVGLIGLFGLQQLYVNKDWETFRAVFLLGMVGIVSLLFSLLLTDFEWIGYIFESTSNLQTSPIGQGTANDSYYSLSVRMSILGFGSIGLIALPSKNVDRFMKIWIASFLLISFSFILPFSIPYFWRFINFVRIPLAYTTVLILFRTTFFTRYSVLRHLIILFMLIASFGLLHRNNLTFDDTTNIHIVDDIRDSVILADPIESNYIGGATSNEVFVIPYGHITSPDLLAVAIERMEIMKRFYEGDATAIDELSAISEIDYVVLNKQSEWYSYDTLKTLYRFNLVDENVQYGIFTLNNDYE